MKKYFRSMFACSLSFLSTLVASKIVTPTFTIRSQSFNAARRLAGHTDHINLYGMKYWYFTKNFTPEYTRSIKPHQITKCLFGDAILDNGTLKIQGSRVLGRDEKALLADYFYLPTDFQSTICFTPRIQNFLVDLNFYVGFENWLKGLYLRIQSPITWTKWALNLRETVNDDGSNNHDAGYFTPNILARDILLDSFTEYATGNSPGIITQFVGTATQEVIVDLQPLKFAKIRHSNRKTALSEIRAAFGYNIILEENYRLGFNIQAAAPTGNKPKAIYLFEAQNGNGKHWEAGIGIDGHYTCWHSEDEERSLEFYMSLDVLHLFKTRQKRTFDLCNKPLSRYMIAEKMTSVIDFNLKGDGIAPIAQFNNIFTPVANLTTFDVDVSIGAHADLVAMLNYTNSNLSLDLGYSFYGRSCEKFKLRCCPEFEENRWALKGDAHVFGFDIDSTPTVVGVVPLSATNNAADINGGSNFGKNGTTTTSNILAAKQNPKIDNKKSATGDSSGGSANTILRVNNTGDNSNTTNPQINTSVEPVFIKQNDINFVRTRGISHKIFGHFQYNWDEHKRNRPVFAKEFSAPYFGFGFEVEFASKENSCCESDCENDCNTSCSDVCNDNVKGNCLRCALSQWGIWLKAGVSFF